MVVFTCGHCGESVQKPKVEKHYLTKCRNRTPNLSCMDCFKDFLGNDYETHVKCITEEQRYSGKGFVAKEKKGEKKQTVWVEMLQSVLDEQKSAPKNVLRIVETISKHNNTPRKKPKFINFVKNVCGAKTNPKDIDQAWELISVKLSELSKCNSSNNADDKKDLSENGHVEENVVENGKKADDSGEELNGDVKDSDIKENDCDALNGDAIKLSKKQRKEEKKRKKYEAELQKAAEPHTEITTEVEEKENQPNKKDKKKKNKEEIISDCNGDMTTEEKNKIKKRKRQDTVNGAVEAVESVTEPVVDIPVAKELKTQKKKPKVIDNEDANLSVCLHDQNVANATESEPKNGKFDWHAVILSVLEKKGNELPFKRLQKKVLGEYSEATGCEIDDRIAEKFIKKIKSCPKVKVDKNRVVLEE